MGKFQLEGGQCHERRLKQMKINVHLFKPFLMTDVNDKK